MEVFKMIHHVNVRVVNELENKILGSIMTIAKEGAVLDEITLSKNAIKELFNKASKKKVCFDWEQYPNCPHCRHSYMLNKIASDKPKHCPECGQALDWEVER